MTSNDVGPIAKKVIAAGRKHQRQQVVDLAMAREARDRMREIIERAKPTDFSGGLTRIHLAVGS